MLYHLLVPLAELNIAFNLFRFQTFRAAGAVVTAFLVAILVRPGHHLAGCACSRWGRSSAPRARRPTWARAARPPWAAC